MATPTRGAVRTTRRAAQTDEEGGMDEEGSTDEEEHKWQDFGRVT